MYRGVFWKVFCCPWTFSEDILRQTFFGTKRSFLRKVPSPLEFSASQKLTESMATRYPCGTHLKILTENLTEKSHNSLFLKDRFFLRMALHVCINYVFKLLLISPFAITNNLKGELHRSTTVFLTKICSFS